LLCQVAISRSGSTSHRIGHPTMMVGMDVELLVLADCPNGPLARGLLRRALDELEMQRVQVRTTTIGSVEQAVRRGFGGSPTILIDGADPFADPGRGPGLSCRLYPTPTGAAGVPSPEHLRLALAAAVATRATRDA
jgi:hypothetical protein